MSTRHYLLGFHKATGELRHEWPVPADSEPAVARVLRAGANRLGAEDPRELTPRQAGGLATLLGQRIDTEAFDWFVQTFAETPARAARQRAAAE